MAKLEADLGGTEILPALRVALEGPRHPSLPRQVVVLTDGQVSNTDAVLALAKKHAAHARIFTFDGAAGERDLVRSAWATALAIAWLRTHARGLEDQWQLLAAKGGRWLDEVEARLAAQRGWMPPSGSSRRIGDHRSLLQRGGPAGERLLDDEVQEAPLCIVFC